MHTIMIVDDEELLLDHLCNLIRKHEGLHLLGTAGNGLDAVEKIRVLRPDIVLTDIVMPGMDGIELVGYCAEHFPWIHFIVLSGHQEFHYAQKALQFGVCDYILKPILQETLFASINRLLDKIDQEGEGAPAPEPHYSRIVESILEQTEANLDNEQLSLKWLCQTRLFINETHAGRLFTKETGNKFSQYVNDRRIQKAVNLLRSNPDINISQLSMMVGYGVNYRYFIENFKKQKGCTPKQFQISLLKENRPASET